MSSIGLLLVIVMFFKQDYLHDTQVTTTTGRLGANYSLNHFEGVKILSYPD